MRILKRVSALILSAIMLLCSVNTEVFADIANEARAKSEEEKNYTYTVNGFGEKVLYSENGRTPGEIDLMETFDIWDTFEYGSYPQTKVTDSSIISALEDKTPDSNGYYKYGGERYAKVKTDYYIVEPIVWRVVWQIDSNSILIMSDNVLDSQIYNNTSSGLSWENSSIRSWLNKDFYNKAFSSAEKAVIHETTIDNSAATSMFNYEQNATKDKVFLFSYKDLINKNYNFNTDPQNDDPQRRSASTEYAQAMGASAGYCNYWTRSCDDTTVQYVLAGDGCVGTCHSPVAANSKGYGVRPLLIVDKDSVFYNSVHRVGDSVTFVFYNLAKYSNDQQFTDNICNKKVTVKYGNKKDEYTTDDNGMLEIKVPETDMISFDIAGYYDYNIYTKAITDDSFPLFLRKIEGSGNPYVSTVFYNKAGSSRWFDLSTNGLTIPVDDTNTYEIDITADWEGHPEGTYYLSQDANHKLSSSTGIFNEIDLYSTFAPSKTIYAYVQSADGKTSNYYATKIDIADKNLGMELLSDGQFKLIDKGLSYTLPDSIPAFGGAEIGLNLPSFPVSVDVQGNTVRMTVGIELFSKETKNKTAKQKQEEEDNYNILKENLKKFNVAEQMKDAKKSAHKQNVYYKHLNTLRKNLKKGGIKGRVFGKGEFNVEFYGYVEFSILEDQWVVNETCGYLFLDAEYSWTQMQLFGPVPVYARISVGGEARGGSSHSRAVADKTVPLEWQIDLEISPKASAALGSGIPKLAYAELEGNVSLPVKYKVFDRYYDISVNGSVSVNVGLVFFTFKKTFVDKTWNIASGTVGASKNSVNAVRGSKGDYTFDESMFTNFVGRNYSAQTKWVGSGGSTKFSALSERDAKLELLQLSAYEDTNVKLVEANGVRMLIWLQDDLTRSEENRTALVYSIYDENSGLWSKPIFIDNADFDEENANYGTADFCPTAVVCGKDIYIAWQNTKNVKSNSEELELSDYAADSEIRVAKYNTSTNTMADAVSITDNDTFDGIPTLAAVGSNVYVSWINNDENSMLGTSGQTNVMTAKVGSNLSFEEPIAVAQNVKAVSSMDSYGIGSELMIAYAADTDGSLDDVSDTEVFLCTVSGDAISKKNVSNNTVLDSAPSFYEKEEAVHLAWYSEGNLYDMRAIGNEKAVPLFESPVVASDMYKIVSNGSNSYIIWAQDNESHVELYASTFENGAYSAPVAITTQNQKVINPDAICDDNGKLIVAMEYVSQVQEEDRWVDKENNVAILESAPFVDLTISSDNIAVTEDMVIPETTIKLPIEVSNMGTKNCSGYKVLIDGKIVYTSDELLVAGDSKEITLDYTFGKSIGENTQVDISVIPNDVSDANMDDNNTQFTYGKPNLNITDVNVKQIYDSAIVSFSIENQSYITSDEYVLEIHKDNAEGEVLFNIDGIPMDGWHYGAIHYNMPAEMLDYSEDGLMQLYIQLKDKETSDLLAYQNATLVKPSFKGVTTSLMNTEIESQVAEAQIVVDNDSLEVMQGYLNLIATDTSGDEVAKSKVFLDLDALAQENVNLSVTLPVGVKADTVKLDVKFEGGKRIYDFVENDNDITITKYYGNEKAIVVPEEIHNLSVTAIKDDAFANHPELTEINIPETVISYGDRAFKNDTGIKKFIIGKNVSNIGGACFRGCTQLADLSIEDGNDDYILIDNILYTKDKAKLIYATVEAEGEITIPDETVEVCAFAFENRDKITLVNYGKNVSVIGQQGFMNCSSLTEIVLPDNLKRIGKKAFEGCCEATKIVTGDGITVLEAGTFGNCEAVTSISLGKSITSLGTNCFTNMKKLDTIEINTNNLPDLSDKQTYFKNVGVDDGIILIMGDSVTRVPAYMTYGTGDYNMAIKAVKLTNNVESIGAYAFYNQQKLITVENMENVATFGDYAFYECSNLETPKWCERLKEIGTYAFYDCKKIKTISIGTELTKIGANAFSNCIAVTQLYWNSNNIASNANVFSSLGTATNGVNVTVGNDVEVLPSYFVGQQSVKVKLVQGGKNVRKIGSYAFYDCSGMTRFIGFENIEAIGSYAFYNCNKLTALPITDKVEAIESYAFYGLNKIEEINLPANLKKVTGYSFGNMTSLKELVIPKKVESIDAYAFYNDIALETIDISEFSGKINGNSFYGCNNIKDIICKDGYKYADGILYNEDMSEVLMVINLASGRVVLPESVLSIRESAFENCAALSEIIIPNGTTIIEKKAFKGCTKLESVTIGESVEMISESAFADCSSLVALKLPQSLKVIETSAFSGCSSLLTLKLSENLETIGSSAFYNCGKLTNIVVPDSVKTVANDAFRYCSMVKAVTIGTGVTSIGSNAFANLSNLEKISFNAIACSDFTSGTVFYNAASASKKLEVTIGDYVKRIPAYFANSDFSLSGTYSLKINLSDSIEEIGKSAFENDAAMSLGESISLPNLKKIGNNAFSGNKFTKIDFPKLETIDERGFYGCNGLTEVVLSDTVESIEAYAFGNCSELINFDTGNGVTHIGNYVWNGDSKLTTLTLGESIKSMDETALYGMRSIEELNLNSISLNDISAKGDFVNYMGQNGEGIVLTLGDKVERIPSYFMYCRYSGSYKPKLAKVIISGSSVDIGDYAFRSCSSLAEIEGKLGNVGRNAFEDCYTLEAITFGDNAKNIGNYAFSGATALVDIILPDSIELIGDYAFNNCSSANEINTGDGVQNIGIYAFNNCNSAKMLTLGKNIVAIGNAAFYSLTALEKLNYNVESPLNFTSSNSSRIFYNMGKTGNGFELIIGENVKTIPNYFMYPYNGSTSYLNKLTSISILGADVEIGTYAFFYCNELEELKAESIKSIGNYAFYNCSKLEDVILPDSLLSVGNYAFAYCSELSSIDTGDGVESIGEYAFYGDAKIGTLTLGKSIRHIGTHAFYSMSGISTINYNIAELENQQSNSNYRAFDRLGTSTGGITVNIGKNVKRIPNYMWYSSNTGTSYINHIVSVKNASSDLEIGDYAFSNCTELNDIDLENVKNIGNYAFSGCVALEGNINLRRASRIGNYAFSNCSRLESIIIGNRAINIEDGAFNNIAAKSLLIPETVTTIGTRAVGYRGTTKVSDFVIYGINGSVANQYATTNGITFTEISTTEMAEGIELVNSSLLMSVGQSEQLQILYTPTYATNGITFESENSDIASVDAKGVVTAVSEGNTIIHVIFADNVYDCEINVTGVIDLADAKVLTKESVEYTGNATTPEVWVELDGELVPSINYDIEYADNIQQGTATVSITGKDGYTGNASTTYEIICKHSNATEIERNPSTCTVAGSITKKCNLCQEEVVSELPLANHTLGDWIVDKEATYTSEGSKHRECSSCNQTVESATISMLTEHSSPVGTILIGDDVWDTFLSTITFGLYVSNKHEIVIEAEDSESGVASIEYYITSASVSLSYLINYVPADAWNIYEGPVKFASEDGKYIVYARITDICGNKAYISSDGYYLDGNPPKIMGAENDLGYCEEVELYITDDNLDKVTLDGETIAGGSFTVSEKGRHLVCATDLAKNETSIEFELYGGHHSVWIVDSSATEEADGIKHLECVNCGKVITTETIPYDGGVSVCEHSYNHSVVEPTCLKDGYTVYTCTKCSDTYSVKDAGSALGHDYEESEELVAADYEHAGLMSFKCSRCDATITDEISVLVDSISPKGEIVIEGNRFKTLLNNITFGLFFNESKDVVVEAYDNESGVDTVGYYCSDEPVEAEYIKNIPWSTYLHSFAIDKNTIVYAKIMDKQGNITYISSQGIVIEDSLPKIEGIVNGYVYCDRQVVTISDENLDMVLVNDNEMFSSSSSKETCVKLELSAKDTKNGKIVINALDKCGNNASVEAIINDGHTYEDTVVEPTASEKGYTLHTCKYCGDSYKDNYTNPIVIPETDDHIVVSFDANGGKNLSFNSKKIEKSKQYGKLPTVVRDGYSFIGWYTGRSGGAKISEKSIVESEQDITLYAHWSKITVAKITGVKLKASKKSFKSSWKKVNGASGYEVRYSTNRSMKKPVIKTTSKATLTVKKLKKGKTYYVQVRAYMMDSANKKITGKWSSVKKIKVK